jgi:hypothetical protein
MKTEIIRVTPTIAAGWLKKNPNNRSIGAKALRDLVADMRAGRWKDNGSAIRFDTNGNLLDGQHRLKAIVLSNTTYNVVVVTGLDPEVFDTIDNGKGRTSYDALEVKKVDHYKRVSSALAVVIMYDRGIKATVRDAIRPNQVMGILEKYPDMPAAIEEIGKQSPRFLTRSLFDGLYYVFRRFDPQMALEYMTALRTGTGIETLDAWHQLRERLIRNQADSAKLKETHIAALIIKGWNLARQGKDVNRMTWAPSKEDFPIAL